MDLGTWLGVVGTILGVAGIVASILTYRWSRRQKMISFASDTSPTELVRPSGSDDPPFRILRQDGKPTRKYVCSTKLYIWNAGNQCVRGTDVLQPLRVKLGNAPVEVLRVAIHKQTRDLVGASAQSETDGAIQLNFNAMEPSDGFALSVVWDQDERPWPFSSFDVHGAVADTELLKAPAKPGGPFSSALEGITAVAVVGVILFLAPAAVSLAALLANWLDLKSQWLQWVIRWPGAALVFGIAALIVLAATMYVTEELWPGLNPLQTKSTRVPTSIK